MAGVEQDARAGMVAGRRQEALEGHAVMQVFAGMQLEAGVDADFFKGVQDGNPAPGLFSKGFLDQPLRSLRPGIKERPRQRPRKSRVGGKAEVPAGLGSAEQLIDRPRPARLLVAAQLSG